MTIRVPRPMIPASSYAPPHQLPKNNQSKTATVKKNPASDGVNPTDIIKQNGYADSSDGKSDSSSEEIAALPPMDDVSIFFVHLGNVNNHGFFILTTQIVLHQETARLIRPVF